MNKVNIFLNYDGKALEAFNFYSKIFNTPIQGICRVQDSPYKDRFPQEQQEAVLWIELVIGNISLYGEDLQFFNRFDGIGAPERTKYPTTFISLAVDSKEEAHRLFDALKEDGKVALPLQTAFFSNCYGRVIDRYGIGWEFML